jgi:CheY-like chemotaxis protein
MIQETVVLIAEDESGHFALVKRNLWRSCVVEDIIQFQDGQEILDFLFNSEPGQGRKSNTRYIIMLDIRMPKVDGKEVLTKLKSDPNLKNIPVIMLTTTDDLEEIDLCYKLGCNFYIIKPADYNKFMEAVQNLGDFLSTGGIQVPAIK